MSVELIRPFGPSIAKVKIPKQLIDNLNEYIDNIILADKMDLSFKENMLTIFDNVKYNGIQGILRADNIKVNLISKKIDIYMNNDKENVQIISK